MKFLLSPQIQQTAIIRETLPEKYARHAIPGASIQYSEGAFGAVINQELQEASYTLGEQLFFIQEETILHPYTEAAMVALHSMLRGSISCILEGAGKVMLVENKCCLYYIPAGVKHTAILKQGQYVSHYISISEDYLRRLARSYTWLTPVHENLVTKSNIGIQLGAVQISIEAKSLLRKMKECDKEGSARDIYLQARLNDLLLSYVEQVSKAKVTDDALVHKSSDAINNLIEFISDNLSLQITIPDLAKHIGMNPNAMERTFKKIHGYPLSTFITVLRINRAKDLLTTTDNSISEICIAVGVPDQSYFASIFKRHTEFTPSDYRKASLSGTGRNFPGMDG